MLNTSFDLFAAWNQKSVEYNCDFTFATKPEISVVCNNVEELAYNSGKLLKIAGEKGLNSAIHLEYNINSKELVLKVNAVDWFRRESPQTAIARKWIDDERKLESDARIVNVPNEDAYVLKEVCSTPGFECRKNCDVYHLPKQNFCKLSFPSGATCRWYVVTDLEIKLDFDIPGYVLLARPEYTRDLLLAPDPRQKNTKKNIPHNNEEMVIDAYFWETVITTCFELSIKCRLDISETIDVVCVNFGTWESGQAVYHKAKTFHGHIHLNLTLSAVNNLAIDFPVLVGRKERPNTYVELKCSDLEVGGLLGAEINGINTKIDSLHKEMHELKDLLLKYFSK